MGGGDVHASLESTVPSIWAMAAIRCRARPGCYSVVMLDARWALTIAASGVAVIAGGCSATASLRSDAGERDVGERADSHALDATSVDATAIDAAAIDATLGPLRVLFVGDRYTIDNDLPEIVRELAASTAEPRVLQLESVLMDGATLRDHTTTTGAIGRIRDGHFDVVVIQGNNTEPLRPASEFRTDAALLDQAAVASGARLVWFATWALRAGHPDYTALPYLVDPRSMTYSVDEAYDFEYVLANTLVHQHGIRAHVGVAFHIAVEEHPEIDLYAADGSHPSAAGSVLAGCVLSQMITGTTASAPDSTPPGVDHATASTLCAIAGRAACLDGTTFCGGDCASLATDALHCGACGNACPGNLPCVGARCHCSDPLFSPCPGRVCRHLSLDVENCGACGVRCGMGQLCEASACVCQSASREHPSTLTAFRPGCVRGTDSRYVWQPDCFAAVSDFCASSSCFAAGFGPTILDDVTCTSADRRMTSYSSLTALVPECTGRDVVTQPACVSAIHRFCVANGAASGFGPVDGDATSITVACVSAATATVVTASFARLRIEWPPCDGTTTRGGRDCAFASDQYCSRDLHRTGGYGPIEVNGDMATIVCLGSHTL